MKMVVHFPLSKFMETEVMTKPRELCVVRKAGGSIIGHPVVFSSDSKHLFVIWGDCIRMYSVETGDLVTTFEGLCEYCVGVSLHPAIPDRIIGISCEGKLVEWQCSKGVNYSFLPLRNIKLGSEKQHLKVISFSVINLEYNADVYAVCLIESGLDLAEVKMFCTETGTEKYLYHEIRADNKSRSLSVRQTNGETLLAAICNKPRAFVTFYLMHGSEVKLNKGSTRNVNFTCVACHPEERCVITGDVTGSVRVWRNLFKNPIYASYHWHTLRVESLVFSGSGTYFYSGGGERVLVKWMLNSPSDKRFIPRLPGEISCLSVSNDNLFVAVSTKDNAIQLVDSTARIIGSIQHFSLPILSSAGKSNAVSLCEMRFDPRTKSFVMNGRTGHIQFFSAELGNVSFLLDVVGRNYVAQVRSGVVRNTDVVKFSFSSDGRWLATVELCENIGIYPSEVRLKFWEFDDMKQNFILNSSIENPHRGKIYAIQFRPASNSENGMCITTGEDMKFRTWVVEEFQVLKMTKTETKFRWIIENVGFYRDLPVRELSFSVDGSLMAVTFGPTLTVWVPGTNQIKCSLTRPNEKSELTHVEFGRKSIHLIVTGNGSGLAVWNLLSLSVLWLVPFNLSVLVSDPESDVMAAFSSTNDVVIFSPNSCEPIFKQNCLIPTKDAAIVNACFIPHTNNDSNKISWQLNSQLYFFTSRQELFCLEDPLTVSSAPVDQALDVMPASFRPQTAYSALLAEQNRSDVVNIANKKHLQLGVPGLKSLNDFLSGPAHTMPPLSLLGYPLLLSFLTAKEEEMDDSFPKTFSRKSNKMECSDDSEDDSPSKTITTGATLEEPKQNQQTKESVFVDIEKNLAEIAGKSFDWVSDLLASL